MRHRLAPLIALACLARPAAAELYSDRDLALVTPSMQANIALMVHDNIAAALPPAQRPRVRSIEVVFPRDGDNPLAFWTQPGRNAIYVPLSSVRFLDDLVITFAWFERNGCDGGYIQAYLYGLLRAGRPLGPPLAAFGIDRDHALGDAFVDDVSGKALNTAMYFLLAHETGHLLLGHVGGLGGAASQAQESAADAFALDIFAHDGAPPAGMVFYFIAGRWRDPVGTEASLSTHPVAPARIAAIANRLAESPGDFSHAEADRALGAQQVRQIARDLGRVAAIASEEQMLTQLPAGLDQLFPASALATACPG